MKMKTKNAIPMHATPTILDKDVVNIVSKTRNTYVIFDDMFKKIFVSEYFVSEECACRKDAWSW